MSTTVNPSMFPTTIDAATLIFDPHFLNMSVERPATTHARRSSTLPTLNNFECRDELFVQLPLLGNALDDTVEALVDAEELSIDIGKRNHWHT